MDQIERGMKRQRLTAQALQPGRKAMDTLCLRNFGPNVNEGHIHRLAAAQPGFLCTHWHRAPKKAICFVKYETPEAAEAAIGPLQAAGEDELAGASTCTRTSSQTQTQT